MLPTASCRWTYAHHVPHGQRMCRKQFRLSEASENGLVSDSAEVLRIL